MTPWTVVHQASLPIANSWNLLKFMPIELVMPSNHLILCCPLLLPPSIFPSIRVFSNESVLCIRRPKYWSFSFSISPSSEYSGLIFFSIDWFNLLAVQGTLKNCLQHYSSKASVLSCSAFFITQLSHPSMTTGKTTALTRQIFVGKVMLTKHFLYLYKYGLLFFPSFSSYSHLSLCVECGGVYFVHRLQDFDMGHNKLEKQWHNKSPDLRKERQIILPQEQ